MACTKNPKKFLWMKYYGDHDFLPIYVKVFMRYGDIFQVHYECARCGCQHRRGIVEWDELLQIGLTNEEIKEIQSSHFGRSLNA